MKPADEQLKLLEQGVEKLYTHEELKKKLEKGAPLRVKLGADPTAPDLHLGHSVVLRKLRQFQDLGHKAVLIIGDYTALIGDPTGQNKTRPMLSPGDIERNATTYFEQAGKILDTSRDKLEIRRNGEWLGKMSLGDLLKLSAQMTAAQMLQRRDFKERFQQDVDIALSEFMYPLMQGWDSVTVHSDVELGGTDQLFNNMVGRDLQRHQGQEPQVVMVLPILEGLDGVEKMSKSKGNYIGLNDPPKDMFGKTMSIGDELMWKWYALLLGRTPAEIAALKQSHPMEAKKALARAIVAQYYGHDAAIEAEQQFTTQFSSKDLAKVAELHRAEKSMKLLDVLFETGKFSSKSEVRRLFSQGGITVNNVKIDDPNAVVKDLGDNFIVCAGKRLVYRIESFAK